MKKIIPVLMAFAIVALLASCGGNKENKENNGQDTTQKTNQTVENMKAAFKGETTASLKYEKFAEKAKAEGYAQIAALFKAASKSEAIHAENHKKVLADMGISVEGITADSFAVKTTAENLQTGIDGETYEVEKMYPPFIAQAEKDGDKKAVKSLNWAMETEKKHTEYYKAALDALNAKKTKTLPAEYFICPKCGYTYNTSDIQDECELCSTAKDKYIAVK